MNTLNNNMGLEYLECFMNTNVIVVAFYCIHLAGHVFVVNMLLNRMLEQLNTVTMELESTFHVPLVIQNKICNRNRLRMEVQYDRMRTWRSLR